MRKILFTLLILFCFISNVFADRHYERDLYSGNGYVTLDVSDIIVITITIEKNAQEYFCDIPERIVQGSRQYEITRNDPLGDQIHIVWENFNGCETIYGFSGNPAIGTMSSFPETFDIGDSFRIYFNIWPFNDYFDVETESPKTTSSTSTSSTSTSSSTTTTTTTICLGEKIYGEDSKETGILRDLRDSILSKTPEGREIIRLYYEWSPVIVMAIEEDEEFKEEVKAIIDEILLGIRQE